MQLVLPQSARLQACLSIILTLSTHILTLDKRRCGRRSEMHKHHLERLHCTCRRRTYAELGQWDHCHHGFTIITCLSSWKYWHLFTTSWRHILREQKLGWTTLYCQVRICVSHLDPHVKFLRSSGTSVTCEYEKKFPEPTLIKRIVNGNGHKFDGGGPFYWVSGQA